LANVEMPFRAGLAAPAAEARQDARTRLFRETPSQTALRWIMGLAYACHPKRIVNLPFLLSWMLADVALGGTVVPDPRRTHLRPDTFAGVARNVTPDTVLAAARLGFFPWCHIGPLTWWTRQNRMVLFLDERHIAKRLKRDMKKSPYRVTFDTAFDDVIKACAGPRKGRPRGLTWITPQIMRLYSDLHDQGQAHSFEVWSPDGELVGGGFGLSVGRIFFTESQFSRASNTSKMGFAVFNHHLAKWGYVLNDGKDFTSTIDAMGFRAIPREEFEALLAEHAHAGGRSGPWTVEADLADVAA
jgi:leucyl/phenylalanyl-tRNA--protein transferase